MCLSARECSFDSVKYLGEKGANVNIKDEDGVSEWDNCSLHISICCGKTSMQVTVVHEAICSQQNFRDMNLFVWVLLNYLVALNGRLNVEKWSGSGSSIPLAPPREPHITLRYRHKGFLMQTEWLSVVPDTPPPFGREFGTETIT